MHENAESADYMILLKKGIFFFVYFPSTSSTKANTQKIDHTQLTATQIRIHPPTFVTLISGLTPSSATDKENNRSKG